MAFSFFFFFKILKNANCDNRVLHSRQREREKDTATHTHTHNNNNNQKKKKKGNRAQGFSASIRSVILFSISLRYSVVFFFFFFVVKQRSQTFSFLFFFLLWLLNRACKDTFFFSLLFPRYFERKQRSDTKKGSFLENRKDVELTAHIRNTIMTLGFGSLFKITRMGTLLFLRLLSSSSFF